MWECKDCYTQFEKPDFEEIDFEEEFKLKNIFPRRDLVKIPICPDCKSRDIEKLKECDRCGEWNFEDDLIDTEGLTGGGVGYYCPQCIKDCEVGM